MEVSLSSGRTIHLMSIRQFPAAGRVLEGPGPSAAALLRSLRARAGDGRGTFLVEPPDRGQGDHSLPAIQCEADFESEPTAGSTEDYSRLTVVWFQVAFAFPPLDPLVLEVLRAVDWERHAVDSTY